jgi:hypothetical protein
VTTPYLALGIPVAGMLFTLGLGLHASQPWDNEAGNTLTDYLSLMMFLGWSLLPYIGMFVLINLCLGKKIVFGVSVAGSSLVVILSALALWDGLITHVDAQSGLLFLFLPIVQWPLLVILALTCFIANKSTR